MSRAMLVITSQQIRETAMLWCSKAPTGTRIEFKAAKRSLPQNARFWAMLTEVSTQVRWHRLKLSPDDWRLMFLDGLKRELRIVPNIDGTGFVNLGRSSSDLTKAEMSDLMELIAKFGAERGITFRDQLAECAA